MPEQAFTVVLSNGKETNSISLPGFMWDLIDSARKRHDWSRSVYCKRAILKALLLELVGDPEMLEQLYHKLVEKS